jgi:hypothetical protein
MGMVGLMERRQGENDEKTGEEERAHAGRSPNFMVEIWRPKTKPLTWQGWI